VAGSAGPNESAEQERHCTIRLHVLARYRDLETTSSITPFTARVRMKALTGGIGSGRPGKIRSVLAAMARATSSMFLSRHPRPRIRALVVTK
jgi:hypothetical protein